MNSGCSRSCRPLPVDRFPSSADVGRHPLDRCKINSCGLLVLSCDPKRPEVLITSGNSGPQRPEPKRREPKRPEERSRTRSDICDEWSTAGMSTGGVCRRAGTSTATTSAAPSDHDRRPQGRAGLDGLEARLRGAANPERSRSHRPLPFVRGAGGGRSRGAPISVAWRRATQADVGQTSSALT